mmetsp:Transcript_35171/g.40108  ORF Transcript_35171/g.40108 Transcript_35171/m.40108 type:complete len:194 (+) Transcript_35171:108-689(+)
MTKTSVRYGQLLKGIEKVLSESRRKLSTSEAVKEGYGDDASIFGGENMLQKVIESMLDRVSETVIENIKVYLQNDHVEQDLLKVEELIQKFKGMEEAVRLINKQDRESTQLALRKALPKLSFKSTDIVRQSTFDIINEEKDQLSYLITELERETRDFEQHTISAEENLQYEISKVEQVSKDLNYTANSCATLT